MHCSQVLFSTRSGVCASNHTHLYSRSTSKTVPRRQGLPPASVCSTLRCVRFKSHTSLFSSTSKTVPRRQGLPPASVCSTLRCVRFKSHTSLFSQHVEDSATTAGLAPCERVFHTRVCDLQRTHLSVLAARQRQYHNGRACPPASVCSTLRCVRFKSHTSLFSRHVKDSATTAGFAPCDRVFHTRVCDLQRTHLSVLAARQRSRHGGSACPLRAWVPRSGVCTSAPSHLDSPSASEDRTTTAGLAPASVCSTIRCVPVSTYSPCIS
jgi:hypothetical protein